MRTFDQEIARRLNEECKGEPVTFVGLGGHDFQISFGDVVRLQTEEKAAFKLRGKTYEWDRGPSEVPVWLIIWQIPVRFELPSPLTLRMHLDSGDYVDFFTDEGPHESVVVEFLSKGPERVMEVF